MDYNNKKAGKKTVDYQIHLTQSDISEIERQQCSVKDYELNALARVLNVSFEWLVGG